MNRGRSPRRARVRASDPRDAIDAIFAAYGIRQAWAPLESTGLANRIYATRDVVLRVATNHPDAVPDARTESVAAPAARAAGVLTPRLIAFDDSRTIVDRPFSLWERVAGETLGLARLEPPCRADVWRAVGHELARLHTGVTSVHDPGGYLDTPGRQPDVEAHIEQLRASGRLDAGPARELTRLFRNLRNTALASVEPRFVHNDIHPMNVMCSGEGTLLALIDWGDAGWGDPTLDFATIPAEAMAFALDGYESISPGGLGAAPEARFAWDKLASAIEDAHHHCQAPLQLDAVLAWVRRIL